MMISKEINLPKRPDATRWAGMPVMEQMANIYSEVGRTSKWKQKGNAQLATQAFIRALDLIDLTIAVGRKGPDTSAADRSPMLRELLRSRDLFCEEFLSEDPAALKPSEKYFSHFARAFAAHRNG